MRPLTLRTNKHLIPVHMRPMIEYSLGTLLHLGLREILVITGRQHMGQVVDLLGSGSRYGAGVDFTFKVQERAGGIAEALGLGERFAAGRRVVVMLGDNVLVHEPALGAAARSFARADPPHAVSFLARVEDPRAYGVAEVEGERVLRIVEKPAEPATNLAVAGLYMYPPDVFARVRTLRPSARGELEVTDLNNLYAREGRLHAVVLERWFDAGEPGPWMRTQRYVEAHPELFGEDRFLAPEDPA
jgi:glucose-1-phosphate thymidylyltransferase